MLKETETEKIIEFFVTFLSLVAFQLGGGRVGLLPPRLCLLVHYYFAISLYYVSNKKKQTVRLEVKVIFCFVIFFFNLSKNNDVLEPKTRRF